MRAAVNAGVASIHWEFDAAMRYRKLWSVEIPTEKYSAGFSGKF